MVQTVRGPVRPDELGPTLMHEHLLCDVTPPDLAAKGGAEVIINLQNIWQINYTWGAQTLGNARIFDRDVAIREMHRMRADGGRSLVELSTHGLRRDPEGLRDIAERADVHVIMGSGHYLNDFVPPEIRRRSADEIAADILSDIRMGVGETGIRAGIIGEMGCSWPWTDAERRAMLGAIVAQRESGASITIHPGRYADSPFEIVRFIAANGGDLSRTIMGHLDRTITDPIALRRLAETGCVIEFDLFGIENTLFPYGDAFLPNDGVRLDLLKSLVDVGHRDQIVVAQDICTKGRQTEFGGHGYGHLFRNVIPLMRRKGFSQQDIDAILLHNPARLLAIPAS